MFFVIVVLLSVSTWLIYFDVINAFSTLIDHFILFFFSFGIIVYSLIFIDVHLAIWPNAAFWIEMLYSIYILLIAEVIAYESNSEIYRHSEIRKSMHCLDERIFDKDYKAMIRIIRWNLAFINWTHMSPISKSRKYQEKIHWWIIYLRNFTIVAFVYLWEASKLVLYFRFKNTH